MRIHHLCLCKYVYKIGEQIFLDPALWFLEGNQDTLNDFEDCLISPYGRSITDEIEFIVTDRKFFKIINELPYLAFIVSAPDEYFIDIPIWNEERWDIEGTKLFTIGWTVYKFTEPAILFGNYPCSVNKDGCIDIYDKNSLNEYGLLKSFEIAEKISLENTKNDPYDEAWRALSIKVDSATLSKLQQIKDKNNSHIFCLDYLPDKILGQII